MRIAITGGAGFLGRLLAEKLGKDKHDVVLLDDFSGSTHRGLDHLPVTVIESSVLEIESQSEALGKIDCLYHLAAVTNPIVCEKEAEYCQEVNLRGTQKAIQFAKDQNIPRFIFTSCGGIEAERFQPLEASGSCDINNYSQSKVEAEKLLLAEQADASISICIARLFNLYGPDLDPLKESAGIVAKMYHSALTGQYVTIFGSGENQRDFMYIEDAIDVLAWLADKQEITGKVDIGTGKATTVNDLAKMMASVAKLQPQITYLPPRPGDILIAVADTKVLTKAKAPQPRSLQEGLKCFRRR